LPLAGRFLQGLVRVQFSRLIALLLESGIPVLQAIEITGKTFDTDFLKKDMEALKEKLAQGRGFSHCLEEVIWMDSLSRMLAASGEESGRLGASLSQIAKDTQAKLEAQIQMLVKLLEPAMILAIGLLVGIVVIATVLPIFDMSGIVQ
jgi:type II secretory pathway component PulF